jgi:hypothetical protein
MPRSQQSPVERVVNLYADLPRAERKAVLQSLGIIERALQKVEAHMVDQTAKALAPPARPVAVPAAPAAAAGRPARRGRRPKSTGAVMVPAAAPAPKRQYRKRRTKAEIEARADAMQATQHTPQEPYYNPIDGDRPEQLDDMPGLVEEVGDEVGDLVGIGEE